MPRGTAKALRFEIRMRVTTETGKELLSWVEETAACLRDYDVQLLGPGFQENFLLTMDPVSRVLFATCSRAWSSLFAAFGPLRI